MAEPHDEGDGQQTDGTGATRPPSARPPVQQPVQQPDAPVLPDRSADDSDEGWGDRGSGGGEERDDDWYQRERPPHW